MSRVLPPDVLQSIVRGGVFYKRPRDRYPRGSGYGVYCNHCGFSSDMGMLGFGRNLDLCLKCAVQAVIATANCTGRTVAEATEHVRTNSVFVVSSDTSQWNSIELRVGSDGLVTGAAPVYIDYVSDEYCDSDVDADMYWMDVENATDPERQAYVYDGDGLPNGADTAGPTPTSHSDGGSNSD
jgi:hypothetical protein